MYARVGSTFKTNRNEEVERGGSNIGNFEQTYFLSAWVLVPPINHNVTIFFVLPDFERLSKLPQADILDIFNNE